MFRFGHDKTGWHGQGGVLVALADKFGLPIHAIGVGEQIDDLAPLIQKILPKR